MTYNFAGKAKIIYRNLMTRYSGEVVVGVLKRHSFTKDRVAQSATETVTQFNLNGIMVRFDQDEQGGELAQEGDIKFICDGDVVINKEDGDTITIDSREYRIMNIHRIDINGILIGQELRLRR